MAAAHWRARKLNNILPVLQDKFERSLNQGVLLELDAGAASFVDDLVESVLAEA